MDHEVYYIQNDKVHSAGFGEDGIQVLSEKFGDILESNDIRKTYSPKS